MFLHVNDFAMLWRTSEKYRFLIIGAANTLLGYLSFACYYMMFAQVMHYLAIALLAHGTAVAMAFYMHRRVVFRSRSPWWPEFARYNISLLGVLLVGLLGLSVLVSVVGVHPLLAQAIVTVMSVVTSYVAHRYYSFRSSLAKHDSWI